jgi:hypothetical protein
MVSVERVQAGPVHEPMRRIDRRFLIVMLDMARRADNAVVVEEVNADTECARPN